jgi:hypothetical protein
VQTAGDRVAAAAELAAGVQDRHDDLERRLALGGVHRDRDATAVVDHAHAAVGEQGDLDVVAVAGQRLVDRVVDHLVDQVVQPALAGGADVHARTLADGLEPLEDGDRGGVVRDLGPTHLLAALAGNLVLRRVRSGGCLIGHGRWCSSVLGRGGVARPSRKRADHSTTAEIGYYGPAQTRQRCPS